MASRVVRLWAIAVLAGHLGATALKVIGNHRPQSTIIKLFYGEPPSRLPLSFVQLGSGSLAGGIPAPPPTPNPELYGTIKVGTPPQTFTVVFDTASGNVLLPARFCSSLACLSHTSYDSSASSTAQKKDAEASMKLGQGEAKGTVTEDTVCIGQDPQICSASMSLIEAKSMTDIPFRDLPYDGIFGLGMRASSLEMGNANSNFLENLASKHVLKTDLFAVWMANIDEGEESTIQFGEADPNRWIGEPIWLQTTSPERNGLWQVNMTDVSSNGVALNLCGSGCQAVFDTGTNAIGVPSGILTGLLSLLKIDPDCANYDQLKPVGFILGTMELQLDVKDYVSKDGDSCNHQFLGIDVDDASSGPVFLLGHPFLRRYYTIYNRLSQSVGVAFSKHKPNAKTKETSSQAAARLMKSRA